MIEIENLKNKKQLGEIGERIAIGELSKYGLDILLPMSDNLPFDFVIFTNNRFYKCQVKTTATKTVNNSMIFSLTSNNWSKGTVHKYNSKEVDIIICCDLSTIYLFPEYDVENRNSITIRSTMPANNQVKGINFVEDCIISSKRLEYVFNAVDNKNKKE